jgi:glycosyltransferase involved in cell wall biosynthesis
MASIHLSIVIPTYNESGIMKETIDGIVSHIRGKYGFPFEILICENGSSDNTMEIAKNLERKHKEVRSLVYPYLYPDYGGAMKNGFLNASGKYMINFSMKFYDFAFLESCLELLKKHDVVMGSKKIGMDGRPLSRRLTTDLFNRMMKMFMGLKATDTHGIKGFRREAVIGLVRKCKLGRALFDTELILRAERAGLDMVEVPVSIKKRSPAKLNMVFQVAVTFIDILKLKVALWRG